MYPMAVFHQRQICWSKCMKGHVDTYPELLRNGGRCVYERVGGERGGFRKGTSINERVKVER